MGQRFQKHPKTETQLLSCYRDTYQSETRELTSFSTSQAVSSVSLSGNLIDPDRKKRTQWQGADIQKCQIVNTCVSSHMTTYLYLQTGVLYRKYPYLEDLENPQSSRPSWPKPPIQQPRADCLAQEKHLKKLLSLEIVIPSLGIPQISLLSCYTPMSNVQTAKKKVRLYDEYPMLYRPVAKSCWQYPTNMNLLFHIDIIDII